MKVLDYAKIISGTCKSFEEFILLVFTECELRGYTANKLEEVIKEAKSIYKEK